ncbi:type II toxin-antitoxin system Phd/YefM family antitoxin [Candidatus Thiosymbion oneisti]|uniref:type II toxin-antitoxin system Phd/YefM family antitoxin n=1 Tax=Candidatus Thiosymbion oneisti TaxID=589554 RepID=UPI000AE49C41|nr:type II toxin-antitoxin system Phd/YefM family antitoxin [Candidatus Thiosymbion oneisti]
MDAITTNQASQMLDSLIERVTANVEPTILCNDIGNRAVLISLDEFNSWQETLYLLSNPVNAEHLYKSIREAKTGKSMEKELIEE